MSSVFRLQSLVTGSRNRRRLWFILLFALALLALNIIAGIGLRRHWATRSAALDNDIPDILYLVAGARAQERRVTALAGYARELARLTPPPLALPEIWIGNDFEIAYWSKSHGRNLTRAEWAVVKLVDRLEDDADRFDVHIVPGRAWGTDGEMAGLAEAVRRRLEALDDRGRSPLLVTLVTCPSHSRRVATRLRSYAPDTLSMKVLTSPDHLREWLPWVTFAEWSKIARDTAGMSSAPFISRAWYQRDLAEPTDSHDRWLPVLLLGTLAIPLYAWLLYPLLLQLAAYSRPRSRIAFSSVSAARTSEGAAAAKPWPDPATANEKEQKTTPASPDTAYLPARAVILIAAHNEAADIEQRLMNLAMQDYPKDRFVIYVGVDGATDDTAAVVETVAARLISAGLRVEVYADTERRGKVATLKRLVARVARDVPDAEWLVFTDANTHFEPDALRRLLEPFTDPGVGGVCGRLILEPPRSVPCRTGTGHASENRYWTWENKLKTLESRLDSCLGANGAIYAVRSRLFPDSLPDNTIVDDLVIGMKVREQGYRMLYEPAAIARETLPATSAEWRRRIRIGAGDFQALNLCRRCLSPRLGWFAWFFFSHKVLRWLTPHLLLMVWGLAAFGMIRGGLAGMTGILYGLVVAGGPLAILAARFGRHRHAVDYFIAMQAALLLGSFQWLRGGLRGDWERTPRRTSE